MLRDILIVLSLILQFLLFLPPLFKLRHLFLVLKKLSNNVWQNRTNRSGTVYHYYKCSSAKKRNAIENMKRPLLAEKELGDWFRYMRNLDLPRLLKI